MNAILVASISSRITDLILFLLPKLHKTTKALSVNKLFDELEEEMINDFSPPTAIFAKLKHFLFPHDLVLVQLLC